MIDLISVFKGATIPDPIAVVSWQTAIRNIQSGRFKSEIDAVRKIKDTTGDDAYKTAKRNLPAVTFCGKFENTRNHKNIVSATGFLIPDLDHLPDVDNVFSLLCQDENIWFAFRSPSGDGIKCALRADGIKEDADIKVLFFAAENYFRLAYNIKIDPACKDIARLTFVSHDPCLFKNPKPKLFDIKKWLPVEPEQKFFKPPDFGQVGWKEKYGLKVLATCCQKVKDAPSSTRHPVRLQQARTVGGWIASGFIDEAVAIEYMENALVAGGTKNISSAMKTVRDGIEYGRKDPLQPEERVGSGNKDDIQYYCDLEEELPPVSSYNNSSKDSEDIKDTRDSEDIKDIHATGGHRRTSGGHPEDMHGHKGHKGHEGHEGQFPKVYNLKCEIYKWIEESVGCFTSDQIDREFGLTSRQDKRNRSNILALACTRSKDKKQIIKKDTSVPGKFHIIDLAVTEIDLFNTDVDPFDVALPFDLHKYCEIPKKGIIMIAGSPDSGKTAIVLNTLKLNLGKHFLTSYIASEGPNEIKKRLLKFKDVPLSEWAKAKYIEKAVDQQSYIEAHNPDGLSIVDYMEEKEGEYFKITSQIRSIYDALGTGVSLICIQKHTESDYGRGGQGTIEKARLSVSLDKLGLVGNDMVVAIKVMKIKNWVQKNLLWHELHFKIKHGAEIEPLTDWMPCSTVNRKLCLAQYQTVAASKNPEKKKEQMDNWVFTFNTDTDIQVGITEETFFKWKETYSNLNLYEELEAIANASITGKLGLKATKSSWMFKITGILENKNKMMTSERVLS